jgi:hypothetical protein
MRPIHGSEIPMDDRMTSDRPSHRSWQVCVASMFGRKSDSRGAGYDVFECRLCGTVVSFKDDGANDVETSAMTSKRRS